MNNKYIKLEKENNTAIYLLKFKKILKIATEIIPKLPTKEDSLLAIAVKSLGIWDSVSALATKHHLWKTRLRKKFICNPFSRINSWKCSEN